MNSRLFPAALVAACLVFPAHSQDQPKPADPAPTTPTTPTPTTPADPPQPVFPEPHAVEKLRREASHVIRMVKNEEVQRFLIATSWLPVLDDRTLYANRAADRKLITKSQYDALPDDKKPGYTAKTSTANEYYYTRYGTPLAYARPLDIYVSLQQEKNFAFAGKKILDFGYGTVGHLRLLASLGADCTGVDVDPVLTALYGDPEDTGVVPGALMTPPMPDGKLTLVEGQWPAAKAVVEKVGGGYDLIISKNTLKNGYIHPAREVNSKMLVHLGVRDEEFVKAVADALKPGGYFMIYNICPKQKEKPEEYIPWADGTCPFPKEMLTAAGFEIVKFDEDDTEQVKEMGRRLGWDTGNNPMDVETDLFAHYTIVRKK